MQGSGKDSRFTQTEPRSDRHGRVVDLRSWKNKRRMENLKQRYWNPRSRFRFVGILLTAAATVMAVLCCFPTVLEKHLILLCWLVSLVSMCYSLFLHARYDTIAKRLMLVNVGSLAVSFVVALLKLTH